MCEMETDCARRDAERLLNLLARATGREQAGNLPLALRQSILFLEAVKGHVVVYIASSEWI